MRGRCRAVCRKFLDSRASDKRDGLAGGSQRLISVRPDRFVRCESAGKAGTFGSMRRESTKRKNSASARRNYPLCRHPMIWSFCPYICGQIPIRGRSAKNIPDFQNRNLGYFCRWIYSGEVLRSTQRRQIFTGYTDKPVSRSSWS